MKLENKIAVVTGAGRGMGHAMALRFAREGAQVVVAEIHEPSAKQTFDEIGKHGMLMLTDMSKVADITALIDKTVESFGRVDVLVNNAGVTKSLGFFDVTEADWDWMYSINARGGDQRQHRHRAGDGLRGEGLRAGADAAAGHEPRAHRAAAPVRRDASS